jgi:hypothetical protein
VVEYTCENQLGVTFLKAVHEGAVADIRSTQQRLITQAKDRLTTAEGDIGISQAELDKQRARVAELGQGGNRETDPLLADFARIQQVKEDSCGQTDVSQYKTDKVVEIAEQMTRKCREAVQQTGRCSETLQQTNRAKWLLCLAQSRQYQGTPRSAIEEAVYQVREMAEKVGRDQDRQLRTAQEQLSAAERRVQSANERLAAARIEAEAAPGSDSMKQQEGFIELQNRRWSNFRTVKEISQWTVQDGQPVYLGSRIDVVFVDRTIEQPVEADFMFTHAAKDALTMDDLLPLYRGLIRQLWTSYEPPKP